MGSWTLGSKIISKEKVDRPYRKCGEAKKFFLILHNFVKIKLMK